MRACTQAVAYVGLALQQLEQLVCKAHRVSWSTAHYCRAKALLCNSPFSGRSFHSAPRALISLDVRRYANRHQPSPRLPSLPVSLLSSPYPAAAATPGAVDSIRDLTPFHLGSSSSQGALPQDASQRASRRPAMLACKLEAVETATQPPRICSPQYGRGSLCQAKPAPSASRGCLSRGGTRSCASAA